MPKKVVLESKKPKLCKEKLLKVEDDY